MKKKDLLSIFLVSFYVMAMVYLIILYKFNFEFSKVNILMILKWYPVSIFITLVVFYLKKSELIMGCSQMTYLHNEK